MHVTHRNIKGALYAYLFDARLTRVTADETQIKPGTLSDQIASAVRRLREKQRLPYTELSERLAKIGRPIPVLGLRRIEKGERRVDVDELVALARALNVPPVWLMFPVGLSEEPVVELLPDRRVHPEGALSWFIGNGRMPSALSQEEYDQKYGRGTRDEATGLYEWYEDPDASWEAAAAPVLLRRQHQRQVSDWYAAVPIARRMASDEASFSEMVFKLRAAAEDSLRTLRAEMRRHGLTLPSLPGELAERLDGGRAGGSRAGGQED